jgi:hypothetical protein
LDGQPVWLASLSKRNTFLLRPDGEPRIVPTFEWSADDFAARWNILLGVLRGVGDPERFRLFRMNVTLCLHRALTDAEVDLLGDEWRSCRATALAGGPVEIIASKGCSDAPSCQPCENVVRTPMDPAQPELWLPDDCGRCDPCLARERILPRRATVPA